jgi:hypothetical protein
MSENNNNNAPNVAAEVGSATVDTPSINLSVKDAVSAIQKKASLGRDRVGEAIDIAKNGKVDYSKTPSVEDLASIQGLDDGGHKGIDYNRVIGSLPDDAKNLLSNLRADYTRKTQELANERKALEAMRTSLNNTEFNSKIDSIANSDTVKLDPYDDESFNRRIEQEVARRMQEMMKPIRIEQELSKKRASLEEFKSKNPDLMDYKDDIASLLNANESLSLQDAYHIVKGKKTNERLRELEQENKIRTEKMREAGLKISSGTRGSDKPPKGLKAHEIYKWYESRKSK